MDRTFKDSVHLFYGTKTCTGCEVTKPRTEFHRRANTKDGLRSQCKICRNKQNQLYRKERSEEISAKNKILRKTDPVWREARAQAAKRWRQKTNQYKYVKGFRERNPDYAKDRAKARYQKLRESGKFRTSRQAIYDRDNGICQLCKIKIDPQKVHPDLMSFSVDHKIPISLGGNDNPGNLQASHLLCNIKKGNKLC